jgi:glycosyltransferase involved in cell wall biosynthesis
MRVTIVTETYFPQLNGVSRTLGQLARVLRASGDLVQLVYPDYGVAAESEGDCLVRSVVPPFYRELHLPLPPFGKVHKAIHAFRPHLVHIATEAFLGLSVLRYARARRIPTVSSYHTNFDQYSAHYRIGWARGTVWRYLRWFHNQAVETYVPTQATADALRARGFEGLVVWPRGVDSRQFRPDRPGRQSVREALGFKPSDLVIAHVSRLAAEKNIGYLAEALEITAQSRPQVRLLIVGDGPERVALVDRLGPHARLVGYRSGEELADHYAAADLFAFSSRTETFGNVVLEAMASSLPVVALCAGGPAETVVHGETGFLVGPDEPPPIFADALVRLVDNREQRLRMARAARTFALGRSWETVMGDLRERYSRIIGDEPEIAGLAVSSAR